MRFSLFVVGHAGRSAELKACSSQRAGNGMLPHEGSASDGRDALAYTR
jgi:hypothetical protein